VEKLLRELNIYLEGSYSKDGSYIVDIYDSDDFGRIYSLLDNNRNVEELESSSLLNTHSANISYLYDDYQLTLIADFDEDLYKLVITEYEYIEDEEEDK
jgi:hypothetical protein